MLDSRCSAGIKARTARLATAERGSRGPRAAVAGAWGRRPHLNFQLCSQAVDQDNPSQENFEETKTTKTDIQQALADAFAYCRGVYEHMSDETGAETIPFIGGQELARSAVLSFNSMHSYEHYGNLVTYMRLNGITPPTTMAARGQ